MQIRPDLQAKVKWLTDRIPNTLGGTLGIDFISIDFDKLVAKMPVVDKVKQPFGILHGGASVALAESLASIGAWLNVDDKLYDVVGVEINANHIKAMSSGCVVGTATPIHKGRRTQVWEVKITNEASKIVCISRCTLAVVEKKGI